MPRNITKTSREIVKEAMAAVPVITAGEALRPVGAANHIFVDLRDGTEQANKTGGSAGAFPASRGMMEFHIDP